MDPFVPIALAALALFGFLANLAGSDSRDGFEEPDRWTLNGRIHPHDR